MSRSHHQDEESTEHTRLLDPRVAELQARKGSRAGSLISSHTSKDEQELGGTAVGERLPYNDYTTIDWLHDLVSRSSINSRFLSNDECRSKTLSVTGQSEPIQACEAVHLRYGTQVKDGSQHR